jgi:hypothetical protein
MNNDDFLIPRAQVYMWALVGIGVYHDAHVQDPDAV